MKFSEIVNEASALLKASGRVSYRALRREFDLDDEALEDLKEELIHARQVAHDEDKRILVWDAARSAAAEIETPPDAAALQTDSTAPLADAENRQLTVMFCDIVGSTRLSEQLDPETFRDVIRAYQGCCASVVERYDGYIAQYLGDGLLIYFGYPAAHEDDAARATRAALDIRKALREAVPETGQSLSVRIGLHTGRVVVGDIGDRERKEKLALGDTPNVAARIQALAEPDGILASEATQRLIEGLFVSRGLGASTIKGIENPLELFEILDVERAGTRFDAARRTRMSALVGRDLEIGLLERHWARAQRGDGQVVLISGEAGIGKSRLVEAMKDRARSTDAQILQFHCAPHQRNTAFHPFVDRLERLVESTPEYDTELRQAGLEAALDGVDFDGATGPALIAQLLDVEPENEASLAAVPPARRKALLIDALVAWIHHASTRGGLLCVFDDLHWSDPSTLEFLDNFLERIAGTTILAILTYRPEFQQRWPLSAHFGQLALNRLSPQQVESIVADITGGRTLPGEVIEQVIERTDGIPLFVEELTKAVVESDLLELRGESYALTGPLPALGIPATLQDSLMARLDRLATTRELAQIGATIGREFSYALIREVRERSEHELIADLDRLVAAGLLLQRGEPPNAEYIFKHALIQDTAYQSMLRGTRQQLHARVARVLEANFAATAAGSPELLAHHFERAGLADKAIHYWQRAGEKAVRQSANSEAVEHLRKGLDLLATTPEDHDRATTELALLARLGPALIATEGYGAPATEQCYVRARVLVGEREDSAHYFPVLYGHWVLTLTWARFPETLEIADAFLARAEQTNDASAVVVGHRLSGFSRSCLGDFAAASEHFEQVDARYDPGLHGDQAYTYGQDPRAAALSMLAWNQWQLGLPDQAARTCERAVEHAEQFGHANTLGYTKTFGAARVHLLRGDLDQLRRTVSQMLALCEQQDLVFWPGFVRTYAGWLEACDGNHLEGIETIEDAIRMLDARKTAMFKPQSLWLLARGRALAGEHRLALEAADEALACVAATNEQWIRPELLRLKAELSMAAARPLDDAELDLDAATIAAERMQARGWALRIATTRARLRTAQGRADEGREQLAHLYGCFSEGFDTADLREAATLLES